MSESTVDYRVLPDGSLRPEPTPGPWRVERDDGQLLIRAGTGNLAGIPDPDDEDEANARLMARAPEQRAALEQIAATIDEFREPATGRNGRAETYRAAIMRLREIRDIAGTALVDEARS